MKNTETKLRAIIDNSPYGFLLIDKNFIVIEFNSTLNLFALNTAGYVYEKNDNLIHKAPKDRVEMLKERLLKVFAGESFTYEAAYENSSSKKTTYIVTINPVKNLDLEIVGACFSVIDVSEKKESEKRLIEANNALELFVNNVSDMVAIHDQQGNYVYVSPSSEKILGYKPENLNGLNPYTFMHPDDVNRIKNSTHSNTLAGDRNQIAEYRLKHKNGNYVWVESTSTPIFNASGDEVIQIHSCTRDISRRKKIDEKLIEKNKDLNTYIYKTSHDLRSPTVSCQGLIQIMRKEFTDEKFLEYINKLEWNNNKMLFLLDSLMQVNVISAKHIQNNKLNPYVVINEIIRQMELQPKAKEINFIVLDEVKTEIFSDSELFISILQNLIQNSINYRNKGGYAFVEIKIQKNNKHLVLTIRDNGVGIPYEHQSKIFEMFYRANPFSEGSGLGLFIVKNATEKLGGNLEFESKVTKGTSFTVSLPFRN